MDKAMTFHIRWEADAGIDLVVEIATDAKDTPLRLGAPAAAIGVGSHEVVLRYTGFRAELFVDGVLVDEEWPMGSVGRSGIRLPEGKVKVWDRALADEEVREISGWRPGFEDRILGPERPVGQFWRPRGFNTHVGDCMPFFHEGRFHLFYLFDRRNCMSKWGLGGHQWAHVSTLDLRKWDHHPLAIRLTQENEGSLCTGSVFFHDGIYHGFYAVRTVDGSPTPICVATSADGVNFAKQPVLTTLREPYLASSGRDPVVFREAATGVFHMLVTTSLLSSSEPNGRIGDNPPHLKAPGCLAHLISRDLRNWEQLDPFILPEYPGEPECPDYFEWNGWYYLVFSNQATARYRMSRHPLGPWQRPAVDLLDDFSASVMKTAAFTGGRRIGAAFVSRGGYGGDVVFREIIQRGDGTLAAKWPAELPEPRT